MVDAAPILLLPAATLIAARLWYRNPRPGQAPPPPPRIPLAPAQVMLVVPWSPGVPAEHVARTLEHAVALRGPLMGIHVQATGAVDDAPLKPRDTRGRVPVTVDRTPRALGSLLLDLPDAATHALLVLPGACPDADILLRCQALTHLPFVQFADDLDGAETDDADAMGAFLAGPVLHSGVDALPTGGFTLVRLDRLATTPWPQGTPRAATLGWGAHLLARGDGGIAIRGVGGRPCVAQSAADRAAQRSDLAAAGVTALLRHPRLWLRPAAVVQLTWWLDLGVFLLPAALGIALAGGPSAAPWLALVAAMWLLDVLSTASNDMLRWPREGRVRLAGAGHAGPLALLAGGVGLLRRRDDHAPPSDPAVRVATAVQACVWLGLATTQPGLVAATLALPGVATLAAAAFPTLPPPRAALAADATWTARLEERPQ